MVQPAVFPDATGGWCLTPKGTVPPLARALSTSEAAGFLRAVGDGVPGPALFSLEPDNKWRSDRCPPVAGGRSRGYVFFEKSGALMGGIRLETIVHWAAMRRLHEQFGWPRDHLVCESPTLVADQQKLLHHDAADILLLDEARPALRASMTPSEVRSRVVVEVKATAAMLADLVEEMRSCRDNRTPHGSEHAKCKAIAVIAPELFLGIAADENWRLFSIDHAEGRAVLGDELPDLGQLKFRQ